VLCSAPRAAAQAACEALWPQIPAVSASGCPKSGTTLTVHANEYLELRQSCDYRGVIIEVVGGNSWLNCNHTVLREDSTTEDKKGIAIDGHGERISNVRVSNCFIDGFENGVRVNAPNHNRTALRQAYWDYEHDLRERYHVLTAMQDDAREHGASGVTIENVHARNTRGTGLYISGHAQNVTLDFVSVEHNGGPGVYIDAESRFNRIFDSCFKNTGREGIAVDGSAGNTIELNYFEASAEGGIFVYKNAGEKNYRVGEEQPGGTHGPRTQHSMGNIIQDNTFYNEDKAVWIASRAPRNYANSGLFWSDPVVYDKGGYEYRRDFAEGNIVRRNRFLDARTDALVIEDDNSVIVDNYFELFPLARSGIYLGSRPRQWVDDPVYGTEIRGNRFVVEGAIVRPAVHEFCTLGSSMTRNFVGPLGGASTLYTFPAAPCPNRGVLHPSLIVAAF